MLRLQPNGKWCRYAHTGSSRAAQGSEAPFDVAVLNDLDQVHLVIDTVDHLPHAADKGIYLKQQLQDKPVEHKEYIDKHGEDLPEIRH